MDKFYSFFSVHSVKGIEKRSLILGMAGHSLEEAMVTLQKVLIENKFYVPTTQECREIKIIIVEYKDAEDDGKEIFHLTIKLEKA